MPERKITYQLLNHKADSGFSTQAPSWQRLYIDSALALADLLVPEDLVKEVERRHIKLFADDKQKLMVAWLKAVLGLFKDQRFAIRRVVFDQFDGKQIQATVWGEAYVPTRHGAAREIPGIAEGNLEMGDSPGEEPLFFARVFFEKLK